MKKFSMGMMLSSLLFIQIGCGEGESAAKAPAAKPADAPSGAGADPVEAAPKADETAK